jgi:hypothetical protein
MARLSAVFVAALLFFMVAPAGARQSNSLRGGAVFSVEGPEISFAAVRTLGLAAHSCRSYPPLPHSPAPARRIRSATMMAQDRNLTLGPVLAV